MDLDHKLRASIGPGRLAGALRYSLAGFRHASRFEAAFQQELIALVALMPLAVWLPVAALERLALVVSMLLVLVVELLNSAIEATVDRISRERHPLAAQAKDMGSAAVLVALGISFLCWATVAGPVVGTWLSHALRSPA